jgi:tyrosinase
MPTRIQRRDFFKRSLALAGALTVDGLSAGRIFSQPADGFLRYSVFDPRARLDSYRRGVEKMKAWSDQNAADPRGWVFQAAIHGSRTPGQFANQCEHASWWFFPWHRAYLHFFERIVRKASGDPDFTLPYWDWNVNGRRALPDAFQDSSSPLYDRSRNRDINAGEPLPAPETDAAAALAASSYLGSGPDLGFGGVPLPGRRKGLMERPPHDSVHVFISGNMGDPRTAALDPIFWLHHANVDRLWDVWLASGRSNPSDDAWKKNLIDGQPKPFVLFDENGQQIEVVTSDFIPGGSRLDYQYDNLQGNSRLLLTDSGMRRRLEEEHMKRAKAAVASLPAPRQKAVDDKRNALFGAAKKITVTSAENRVVLGAAPLSVQALIPEDNQPRLKSALELAREDAASPPAVILNVEDVQSSAPPGVVFRVFLNQPKATATTNTDEANYVGSIALFQSSGHGVGQKDAHKNLLGETFSFDITRMVENLKKRGRWDESKVQVTLVSKGVGDNTKPDGEVTFKRVSVTIEPR